MQVFEEPNKQDWEALLKRPSFDAAELLPKVQSILDAVASEGDAALFRLSETFDQVQLKTIAIDPAMIQAAEALVAPALKTAIQSAKVNIEIFHQAQIKKEEKIETMPGVWCWRKAVGIEKVGIYIPGGTAPLFSTVLMLGVPAKLAGCKEVILCTPPRKDGTVDPAILYAAGLVGIEQIYTIGGAQAIAAMAYGTATVPKVFKIFGPGNQYVTAAKQLIQQQGVAIDMPAGPSEVCVYADETAVPAFVAADLLSQAEHGADSQVLLIASNNNIVEQVQLELAQQLAELPRADFATKALGHSKAIVIALREDAIQLINAYAPEHLILSVDNALVVAEKIINAGSVFIGNYSPESVGDYASGTNHTLPTNGYAKAYSGVSVDSFVKKITFQQLTEMGLRNIAQTVIQMASGEQLEAHAQAVAIRVKDIESKM
ncbi:MAG: histidinol dehydrogenase [Chitinophagaceae bacterium]|jgi:histidinol dehydrogenase|nr:histidinol dehydrogenase [Chitinophagaceae bacterium]MCF8288920.1 histidinol dehydrogenase [Chitinophagaceae bacterium]MCF8422545.1 histidinol dehydrogenase [Chitinophagaceae bacterium]